MEEWRDVEGWPGYQVSSHGRIAFQGELRKATKKDNGYYVVGLWHRATKEVKTARVNVLVCHAFHSEDYFEGAYALHKDHNRANNWADNLYWGTQKQNMTDMVEAGRDTSGGRNKTTKLDWDKVREIKRKKAEGALTKDLSREYGVRVQTLNFIFRGETWKEPING